MKFNNLHSKYIIQACALIFIFLASPVTLVSQNCPTGTSITSVQGNGSFCEGSITMTIDATITLSGGGKKPTELYQWYYNTTANTFDGNEVILTGETSASYSPPIDATTAGTTRYYFCVGYAEGTCGQTNSTPSLASNTWEVTVIDAPDVVTVSNDGGIFCGSTTLTASGGTGGTIYYQGTTSGNTSTASPSTSEVITASGTYYFRAENGGCWGPEGSASVTINPNPTITLDNNPSGCQGTSPGLSYSATTGSPDEYSIDYDATAEAQGFTDITNTPIPVSPINLAIPANAAEGTYNFTITVINTTTSCSSIAYNRTISVNTPIPATPGVISGPNSVSPSQSGLNYSITAVTGATGYTWTVPAGWPAITSGQGTTSIVTDAGAAGTSGDLTVTADNSCGSSSAQTLSITVATNPTITLDATNATVCQGITSSSIPYSATSGSPDQYSIDYDGTAQTENFVDVINASLGASPIPLTIPSGATPATYNAILTVRNSGSGLSSINYNITVTVNPPTPATPGAISGNTSVPPGQTGEIYSISAVPNATTYNWTVPTGWSITGGSGSTSITVTAGSIGQDGNITVNAENSCGTSANSSLGVVVANNPPTITLDATNVDVCQGQTSANLSFSATTDNPDLYSINYKGGGHSFIDVTDAALGASPIVLVVDAAEGTGVVNADLTVKNSGTGLSSGIYAITINVKATPTAPTITPSGATTFCSPGSINLSSSATTGTYLWSTTETSQVISVSSSGSYTVTVTENGCSNASAPTIVTVNSTPATPGAITGTADVTPNTSGLTYSISSVAGATTYNWTVPTGWAIDSGDGTTSISVTSGNDGQNGNITVTAQNTCGTSAASTLAVTSTAGALPPTISLGTNPEVCQGTTSANLSYSATTNSPDLYSIDYSVAAEAQGFSDVSDATLPVSPISLIVPAAAAKGTYTASLSVKNSTSGLSSGFYPISVAVNTKVSQPIGGSAEVAPNTTDYIYYVSTVSDASDYNWSVPTGWTITAGQGTDIITVTTGAIGQDGDISVEITNPCGLGSPTTFAVVVSDPTVAKHTLTTCSSCHVIHKAAGSTITNASANETLCLSCHIPGQMASTMPFQEIDKAIPGTSGTSHNWDIAAVNTTYETKLPTNTEMSKRLTADNKIVCSTCHDQHNSASTAPYLRIDNTNDAMCKDCHRDRNVGRYTDPTPGYGSHPVGITIDTNGVKIKNDPAIHNTIVDCSTCHGVHDVDGTVGLTNDGYLLRKTNDNNLCLDCHEPMTHNGFTCKDCHQTHNPNKANIYMIKNTVNGSTVNFTGLTGGKSFADGDGTYDGICEVCHVPDGTPLSYHRSDGTGAAHNDGQNCTTCHEHNSNFSPAGGCIDCHNSEQGALPRPQIVGTGGEFDNPSTHTAAAPVDDDCKSCHSNDGHKDGTISLLNIDLGTRWSGDKDNYCIQCHDATPPANMPAETKYNKSAFTSSSHDFATNSCLQCHNDHGSPNANLLLQATNYDVCLTCHTSGQSAATYSIDSWTSAVPGTSGNTHAWGVSGTNATYESDPSSNATISARLEGGTDMVCSTCHDPHTLNNSQRTVLANTTDQMCKACHSARDIGTYAMSSSNKGSHPVGVVFDAADSRFNASPTLISDGETMQCSSCHDIHNAATNDGYLLKTTNDNNLCKDCHVSTYGGHSALNMDCMDCHQMHNNDKNNLYLIKSTITTPNSGDKTVVFTAQTSTNSFADGDGTYNGICEVCHTNNTNTWHYNTSAGDHTHNAGTNCTGCHPHADNFTPAGGCTTCHNTVKGARRAVTDDFTRISHHVSSAVQDSDCEVCHDQSAHQGGNVRLKNVDTGVGFEYSTATANEKNTFCLRCHDADGVNGDVTPFSDNIDVTAYTIDETAWGTASHNTSASVGACIDCHDNGHGSNKVKMLAPWNYTTDGDPDDPMMQEERFCYNCHSSSGYAKSGTATIDVNAHFAPVTNWANAGAGSNNLVNLNDRHDIKATDQAISGAKIECINCHDVHAANNTNPLIADPDPTDGRVPGSGYLNPPNPNDFMTDWCLDCHDGSLPAGVIDGHVDDKGNPDLLVNVYAEHSGTKGDTHGSSSGGPNSIINDGPPDSDGYINDMTVECLDCHVRHISDPTPVTGKTNIFHLKTIVTAKSDGSPLQGKLNVSSLSTMDYEMTILDAFVNDNQNGFMWCNTCHDGDDMKNGEANCASCHMHGSRF